MSADPRDPAFDDRAYCDACLHEFTEDECASMPDDPIEWLCPACETLIASTLTHAQMRERRAIERADWDMARDDGLIR